MSVYLDEASTTKPRQEVVDAMLTYLTDKWHNPSSLYGSGANVKHDIEAARKTIADFINAEPEEIYFTSGASESNSWALQGFVRDNIKRNRRPCIITSSIEHKSINSCIEGIRTWDLGTAYVEVDEYGFVKMDGLKDALQCHSFMGEFNILTSIQFANNEIGTIQDIKAISNLVHSYNGILHTDATQAFGKIPIDVKELGIDMMSVSGHKLGAVKGIGFLYIKNCINIQPIIYGAQERGMRGGTENVAGIIGLAKAVELCEISMKKVREICEKRDYFYQLLEFKFNCKSNGSWSSRLPNNLSVTFPNNITGESLLYTLDLSGVQIGVGSACNSQSIKPSHVLKSIGLTDEEAMKTVRFTLPENITYKEIDFVIDEIDKTIKIIES